MPNFSTADVIINTAMQELGLGRVSLSSGANDQLGFQALGLLNALCEEIVTMHDWQNLELTANFVGDGVMSSFPLPNDFGRQVNQTAWDTANRRPMAGPVTSMIWGWLKYGLVSSTVQLRYRLLANEYNVFPVPALGETFSLFYISKNWCQSGNDPEVFQSTITGPNDVPQFDKRMLVSGLKVKFWSQKGFETTTLERNFNAALQAQKGQSQGASIIDLSGNAYGDRLIDTNNVSDTGYGLP